MILSPHEMAYLLKWAKIPDADLQIGVAIGCAESGGDTDAMGRSKTGANIGQRDHGWMQVSGRWQYDKLIKYGNFRDPWANALMAAAVYFESVANKKPGWDPWSTFHGTATVPASYLQWMPDAAFGVAHPFPPPKAAALDLSTLSSTVAALNAALGQSIPKNDAALAALKTQVTALYVLVDGWADVPYTGTITLTPKSS